MIPCVHCPAPDPARCPAMTIPHPHFCEMAARPPVAAAVLRTLRGEVAYRRPGDPAPVYFGPHDNPAPRPCCGQPDPAAFFGSEPS